MRCTRLALPCLLLAMTSACTGALKWHGAGEQFFLVKAASKPHNHDFGHNESVSFQGNCHRNIPIIVTGDVYFRKVSDGSAVVDANGALVREAYLPCGDNAEIGAELTASDGTPVSLRIDDAATEAELTARELAPDANTAQSIHELRYVELFQRDANGVKSPDIFRYTYRSNYCKNAVTLSHGFSGGDGSAADPYRICDIQQFWNSHIVSKANATSSNRLSFRLKSFLDLSAEKQHYDDAGRIAVNSSGQDINDFYDNFDGENREIRGFQIQDTDFPIASADPASLGLFPQIHEFATIKNLHISDCSVDFSNIGDNSTFTVLPSIYAGCLVGSLKTGLTGTPQISRIRLTSPLISKNVTYDAADDTDSNIGALIGRVSPDDTLTSSATDTPNGRFFQGPHLEKIYVYEFNAQANANIGCVVGVITSVSQGIKRASTPFTASHITCIKPVIHFDHGVGLFAASSDQTLQIDHASLDNLNSNKIQMSHSPLEHFDLSGFSSALQYHQLVSAGGVLGVYSAIAQTRANSSQLTTFNNVQTVVSLNQYTVNDIGNLGGLIGTWAVVEYGIVVDRVSTVFAVTNQTAGPIVVARTGGLVGGMNAAAPGAVIDISVGAFAFFTNISNPAQVFADSMLHSPPPGPGGNFPLYDQDATLGYFVGSYDSNDISPIHIHADQSAFFTLIPNLRGSQIANTNQDAYEDNLHNDLSDEFSPDPGDNGLKLINYHLPANPPVPLISGVLLNIDGFDLLGTDPGAMLQYFGPGWARDDDGPVPYTPRMTAPYTPGVN